MFEKTLVTTPSGLSLVTKANYLNYSNMNVGYCVLAHDELYKSYLKLERYLFTFSFKLINYLTIFKFLTWHHSGYL